MGTVRIDSTNEGNFRAKTLIPKGDYLFEIANDLVVEKAKSSQNNVVNVELRCQDDGPAKGSVVFDTIALTKKAEWKLCHLVLAAGTQSKAEMKADGIELSLLKGQIVKAGVDIQPARSAPDGGQYAAKNRVTQYCFTPEDAPVV